MGKKKVKIHLDEKGKIDKELDVEMSLADVRKELLDIITFPFVFADEDEKEIPKDKEDNTKLEDILDGKNLYVKKEKIVRKMLGVKCGSKDGIDFYVYPQKKLTNEEKNCSSNIMVIGETGVGKSTWLHGFINYMQGIQIEENNRYYLFDEKALQLEYAKKHGKKPDGSSVTDSPAIYNIESTILYKNPIRLIDTAGFGDTRGEKYDEKITKDIQNLFESSEIENLNAICLIFKATETRAHDRAKKVIKKLFSLFGEEIKNNIIIIFTFADDFNDIPALNTLKDQTSPFAKILGNIENLPHFAFNNKAYFSPNRNRFSETYENNTKNFGKLLQTIFELRRISLESSKEVINKRMQIKNNISNLCDQLNDIMLIIKSATGFQQKLMELQKDYEKNTENEVPTIPYTDCINYTDVESQEVRCDSGWYVLYCNSCNKVCHKKCKGKNEGWHSTEYGCNIITTIGHKCTNCSCKDTSHRFKDSYIIKVEVPKTKYVVKYKKDPKAVQTEEEKRKIRDELNKSIEDGNKKLLIINQQIHDSLRKGIDCLLQLALKNNDLNKLALQKDEQKYGFTKEILNENMKNKQKSEIFDIFNSSLDHIEQLCENDNAKEKTVNDIQKNLLNNNK